MKQLQKIAYINRFTEAGIEDNETAKTLNFMNSFYDYDQSREPNGFKSIHSRPNSQLEKTAFSIGSAGKMRKALASKDLGKASIGANMNKRVNMMPDVIKTKPKSFNAANRDALFSGKGGASASEKAAEKAKKLKGGLGKIKTTAGKAIEAVGKKIRGSNEGNAVS